MEASITLLASFPIALDAKVLKTVFLTISQENSLQVTSSADFFFPQTLVSQLICLHSTIKVTVGVPSHL